MAVRGSEARARMALPGIWHTARTPGTPFIKYRLPGIAHRDPKIEGLGHFRQIAGDHARADEEQLPSRAIAMG